MRTQPRTQQGTETFQGVDMNFMETITIVVTSILASGMITVLWS